jgi:hypothetical protein
MKSAIGLDVSADILLTVEKVHTEKQTSWSVEIICYYSADGQQLAITYQMATETTAIIKIISDLD